MTREEMVRLIRRYSPVVQFYSGGDQVALVCPFHHGHKRNLWLSLKQGVFICYRCNETGTFHKLLRRMKMESPAKFIDVDLSQIKTIRVPAPEAPVASQSMCLPEEYREAWGTAASKSLIGQRAIKYLEGREVSQDLAEVYRLGYCPSGPYADRIIIPTFDVAGGLVYWVARDMTGQQKIKIKNPPAGLFGVGSKDCVFGINLACQFDTGVICEGVFDAMAVGLQAMALFGKTISRVQIQLILSVSFKRLLVLLDADAYREGMAVAEALITTPLRPRPAVLIGFLQHGQLRRHGDPDSERQQLMSTPVTLIRDLADIIVPLVPLVPTHIEPTELGCVGQLLANHWSGRSE
jgi:DNA primase